MGPRVWDLGVSPSSLPRLGARVGPPKEGPKNLGADFDRFFFFARVFGGGFPENRLPKQIGYQLILTSQIWRT